MLKSINCFELVAKSLYRDAYLFVTGIKYSEIVEDRVAWALVKPVTSIELPYLDKIDHSYNDKVFLYPGFSNAATSNCLATGGFISLLSTGFIFNMKLYEMLYDYECNSSYYNVLYDYFIKKGHYELETWNEY